jgi:DNA-binding FadR family transcriptional regulator
MTDPDNVMPRSDHLFAPMRSQSSVDQVVDRILTAIALGQYAVGDRFPAERQLAGQMSVSRNTVRDAIGRLTGMGVLDVRRGRAGGAFVRESWSEEIASGVRRSLNVDWPQIRLLLDLHSLVEGLVAATAAERATASQRRTISEAATAHSEAKVPADIRATDRQLHSAIAEATGNPYLLQMRDRIAAAVGLSLGSDPYVDDPAVTRRAVRQHKALSTAIAGRDATRANAIARRHFLINVDAVESLRSRTAKDPGTS